MKWLKHKIEQIRFRDKLRGMDFIWYFTGGYSWDIFPPRTTICTPGKSWTGSESDLSRSWRPW